MAYDRYVAISHPLHYTSIMRERLYVLLVAGSWITSCGSALLHTLLLAQVSSCADNIIPHFFCSLSIPLKLFCELVIFTEGVMVVIFPLSDILVCYGHTRASILRVPLPKGLQSLVHLWVPPVDDVSLLWDNFGSELFFLIKQLHWQGHDCPSDVHSSHPRVKSLHLQPEKQRYEIGSETIFRKSILFPKLESPDCVLISQCDLVGHPEKWCVDHPSL